MSRNFAATEICGELISRHYTCSDERATPRLPFWRQRTTRARRLLIFPARLSKSVAAGRQRRRSDRYRELAEPRCCDRILAARPADLEVDPTRVHRGKLQRRQNPCSR